MHGILDNPEVLDNLAEGFDKETTDHPFDYAAFKEEQYDKLANLVRNMSIWIISIGNWFDNCQLFQRSTLATRHPV